MRVTDIRPWPCDPSETFQHGVIYYGEDGRHYVCERDGALINLWDMPGNAGVLTWEPTSVRDASADVAQTDVRGRIAGNAAGEEPATRPSS